MMSSQKFVLYAALGLMAASVAYSAVTGLDSLANIRRGSGARQGRDDPKDDMEVDVAYPGAQMQFCITVVKVCKELIEHCDTVDDLHSTFCCLGKPFFWPIFKIENKPHDVTDRRARQARALEIAETEQAIVDDPAFQKFAYQHFGDKLRK